MFKSYKNMRRGMLLIEVYEKIWTIRAYRAQGKKDDEQRHQDLTR